MSSTRQWYNIQHATHIILIIILILNIHLDRSREDTAQIGIHAVGSRYFGIYCAMLCIHADAMCYGSPAQRAELYLVSMRTRLAQTQVPAGQQYY